MKKFEEADYKFCDNCDCIMPIVMFGKNSSEPDGLQHTCRECHLEMVADWQRRNPIKQKGYQRVSNSRYRARMTDLDKIAEVSRRHFYPNKKRRGIGSIQRYYNGYDTQGVSDEEYKHRRIKDAIGHAKRKNLGYNMPIENIIEEPYVWHHRSNTTMVAIPEDIHILYKPGLSLQEHRFLCNQVIRQIYISSVMFN